jgi:hypothetical protein
MATNPRRFRLWPVPAGTDESSTCIEGIRFSDGSIVVNLNGQINGVLSFRDRTVQQIISANIFIRPLRVEWLDGAHQQ